MAVMGWDGRSGWPRVGWRRAGSMRVGVAALACASALTLSACDIRLETPPVIFPSPDATTVARNSLADAEAAVLAAATEAGASAEETASGAAATAQKHLDVLGGVYVAYPGTTPSPSPSAAPPPTLAEAIDAVRSTAEKVAATTDDADLAFLARSIDLDWALRELWAARARSKARGRRRRGGQCVGPGIGGGNGASHAWPIRHRDPHAQSPARRLRRRAVPLRQRRFRIGALLSRCRHDGPDGQDQLSALTVAEDEARFAYETIAALEFGTLRQRHSRQDAPPRRALGRPRRRADVAARRRRREQSPTRARRCTNCGTSTCRAPTRARLSRGRSRSTWAIAMPRCLTARPRRCRVAHQRGVRLVREGDGDARLHDRRLADAARAQGGRRVGVAQGLRGVNRADSG